MWYREREREERGVERGLGGQRRISGSAFLYMNEWILFLSLALQTAGQAYETIQKHKRVYNRAAKGFQSWGRKSPEGTISLKMKMRSCFIVTQILFRIFVGIDSTGFPCCVPCDTSFPSLIWIELVKHMHKNSENDATARSSAWVQRPFSFVALLQQSWNCRDRQYDTTI